MDYVYFAPHQSICKEDIDVLLEVGRVSRVLHGVRKASAFITDLNFRTSLCTPLDCALASFQVWSRCLAGAPVERHVENKRCLGGRGLLGYGIREGQYPTSDGNRIVVSSIALRCGACCWAAQMVLSGEANCLLFPSNAS